jgi:hypothetical protein
MTDFTRFLTKTHVLSPHVWVTLDVRTTVLHHRVATQKLGLPSVSELRWQVKEASGSVFVVCA